MRGYAYVQPPNIVPLKLLSPKLPDTFITRNSKIELRTDGEFVLWLEATRIWLNFL